MGLSVGEDFCDHSLRRFDDIAALTGGKRTGIDMATTAITYS